MPKPLINKRQPDPLELFTDRKDEQEILEKLLAPEPTSSLGRSYLLTQFYGVGGVGKSTLCRRACEIAEEKFKDTVRVVDTSFDQWNKSSAFTEVCAELCRRLQAQKIAPLLTVALLSLHGQQTGRKDEVAGDLDTGWDLAFKAMEKITSLMSIPGLGLTVQAAEWGAKRALNRDRWQTLRERLDDLGLRPEKQYGKLDILDLEKKLSRALYHDVMKWLEDNPGLHLRLLLDGFEPLQSSDRHDDAQQRLQEFIGFFAGSEEREACNRFRVVIFGRNKLRWDEIYEDAAWRDCWNLHLLGGLAEVDARVFLEKTRTWHDEHGQANLKKALADFEEKILNATDETNSGQRTFYPYYLALAVGLVDKAFQAGPETLRTLDLGKKPAELQERFLNKYLDEAERRALMILALSEVFDEQLFDWLARERLIEYPQHSFHSRLRREQSFLEKVEGSDRDWRFHRLMGDALHACWQSTADYKREGANVVQRLLQYYAGPLLAKPERNWTAADIELWSRGMEIIVTQGPELGLLQTEEWTELLKQRPWSIDHHLCLHPRIAFQERILRGANQILAADHPATLTSMNSLAEAYRDAGKLDQALPLHEETLKLRKAKLGPEHPDTLTSMNNLALAYYTAGKRDQALTLYEETLKLREAKLGPEHPDTLISMGNNSLHHASSQFTVDKATQLEIFVGSLTAGELDEALPLLEKTLKLSKAKLGLEHPSTLASMNNLAVGYQDAGKLDQALPLFEETLKL
ncbi:MAG: tetratricopeptide repeat protein, partial [Gammaproteobacteria bacterium]|nr:tetratricopeptide repeat protein [Gammaproteobacteria bacterium]